MSGQEKGRMGRGAVWKTVLVLSLALNLLVLGTIGGAVFSGRFGDGPPGKVDLSMGPLLRALPEEAQQGLREDLRQRLRERGDDWRDHGPPGGGPGLREVVEILRADPFALEALSAYLDGQTARAEAAARAARDAFAEQVMALDPQDRAAMADRLEDEMRNFRPPPAGGN